ERMAEIVLLHDPRRPEDRTVEAILMAVLLDHFLFDDLREGIDAGIGAPWRQLGHGLGIVDETVSDRGIAAHQHELPERLADARSFEEQEQALDGDVD